MDVFFVQLKRRGLDEPRRRINLDMRKAREEAYHDFSLTAREGFLKLTTDQMRDTEEKIGLFMQEKFPEYVPLNHHLHKYQMRAIQRQHSKHTPKNQMSVYNLYTGGEGQTEKRMSEIRPRQVSKVAPNSASESEEEQ